MPLDPVPAPPWTLRGEAIAFLAPRFRVRLLVNYHASPVGPYLEHALVEMTPRGPSVVQMSVNLEASRRGGRENWGFPKILEHLSWAASGKSLSFSRNDEKFRVRKSCLRFPVVFPFWTIQQHEGSTVRVPATLRGQARLGFRGRQVAVILDEFEMRFEGPQKLD